MLLSSTVVDLSGADLFSMESLMALLALTAMEIVLGIDNIVFIAIITSRLPPDKQSLGRRTGLFLAMLMRIVLLMGIGWIMSLTQPIFEIASYMPVESWAHWFAEDAEVNEVTWRDLILLFGGLFLIYSSVREIHHKIDAPDEHSEMADVPKKISLRSVLLRIALMDLIFSLDSVITAVGMADHIIIMVTAVVISVGVMIVFANQISDFVEQHATVKMLALSFLLLIGVVLISESTGTPIRKGYVYFAMAFSLAVEFLNLGARIRPTRGEGETGAVHRKASPGPLVGEPE